MKTTGSQSLGEEEEVSFLGLREEEDTGEGKMALFNVGKGIVRPSGGFCYRKNFQHRIDDESRTIDSVPSG